MGSGLHTNCVSIGAGLHTNCVSNVSMGAGHHTSCVSMGAGHLCNVNIITLATLSHTPIRPSLVLSKSRQHFTRYWAMDVSHVGSPRVSGQAAHEDDAAPVHPDHGGQELSQYPDLTHQVDLNTL